MSEYARLLGSGRNSQPLDISENARLLGSDQNPQPRSFFFSSVRSKFAMVVFIVLLDKTLMILSYDSEWFGNVRELGVYGTFVQRSAESELQRATMKVSDVFVDPELLGWPKRKKKKHSLLKMAPEGCETTVMRIRHCEKYNLKSHCNYVGYERAMYLATQFGHDKSNRWPAPSKIYALQVKRRHGKHKNFRELETVQEIAKKLKLPINEEFHTSDTKQLATTLLRSILQGEHCGGLILISWKHSNLPNLARKLGCGPLEGCPYDYKGRDFDSVWQLKYVYRSFHHGRADRKLVKHWNLFGSVQQEHFDPLAFSKIVGDYPPEGTDKGGRWVPSANFELFG